MKLGADAPDGLGVPSLKLPQQELAQFSKGLLRLEGNASSDISPLSAAAGRHFGSP
jgi:hypothetical protein